MDSTSASLSGKPRVQNSGPKTCNFPDVFLLYSLLPEGKFRYKTSYHSPAASFLILSNSLFTNDLLA